MTSFQVSLSFNLFTAKTESGRNFMNKCQSNSQMNEIAEFRPQNPKQTHFQMTRTYLISVSSSTMRSHLVSGTALLRNFWRIANVFPQWPANTDMLSTEWPVWLNHILTIWFTKINDPVRKKITVGISSYLYAQMPSCTQTQTQGSSNKNYSHLLFGLDLKGVKQTKSHSC